MAHAVISQKGPVLCKDIAIASQITSQITIGVCQDIQNYGLYNFMLHNVFSSGIVRVILKADEN
jgi:hypothetical protein